MSRLNKTMVRFAILLMLPAMLFASGCEGFSPVAEVQMTNPYDLGQGSKCDTFLIPVSIGDKHYNFIMDTGVAVTVVDDDLKKLLGKKISEDKPQANNAHPVEYYKTKDPVKLGIMSIGAVACMDIDAKIQGCDIDGILGENIMKELIVQFDIENKVFRLCKNAPLADTAETRQKWGSEVNFRRDGNGLHCIDLQVSKGIVETFVLDTGLMGMGLMREDLFDILKETGDLKLQLQGNVMQSKRNASILRELSTGNVKAERLGFVSYPNDKLPFDGKSIIGTQFMKKFKMVTFDLSHEKIYLLQ